MRTQWKFLLKAEQFDFYLAAQKFLTFSFATLWMEICNEFIRSIIDSIFLIQRRDLCSPLLMAYYIQVTVMYRIYALQCKCHVGFYEANVTIMHH